MKTPLPSLLCLLVACHVLPVAASAARVEYHEGLPIVFLEGTPYELGRQHGALLRDQVQGAVGHILGYFRGYLKVPWVRSWAINWWLDRAWRQATPFIPAAYLEELKGLAEGSGVPLRELCRLHAIPDRTYACSNFAAWGRATAGGRMIHGRNLDWNINAGIQQFPAVFVVRPTGKRAFVNIGWAGFIGVLTGVNDARLSVGQVGAETVDATFRGEPMVFLMRRLLEETSSLEEASHMILTAQRTVGVNYVLADANVGRAIVLETTHRYAKLFHANDPAEQVVAYARPLPDAVFRADTAMDLIIRNLQLASNGDPRRPGLEDPAGSAYETRYLGQGASLAAHFGTLDPETARAMLQAVAPDSNIQSVVLAWPDVWVANAHGTTPAARTAYHHLDLAALLTE